MTLQLNAPGEGIRFKEFYGPNNKQMFSLVVERRTLLSAAGFMRRYLEVLKLYGNATQDWKPTYDNVLRAWEDNYFNLGDGALRHSDGRMKVALDAPYIRALTPETRLVNGAVDLSDSYYAALDGEEFSNADVGKYCVTVLGSDAKKNPVWLALARGDSALLDEFVGGRLERAARFIYRRDEFMGVHAPPVPKEGAAGRLWTVHRFSAGISSSMAYGSSHLDHKYDGCLVGEEPEAQHGAAAGQLERKVAVPK